MAAEFFSELSQPAAYVTLTSELLAIAGHLGMISDDFTRLYENYDRLVEMHPRKSSRDWTKCSGRIQVAHCAY